MKMLTYILLSTLVILLFDFVGGVKPVFDVANNMRLVHLPGKKEGIFFTH